jgi:hypothetical protein
MIYGYARCSTVETRHDINRQLRELKASGATDGTIYLEYQSGTKSDRVELNKVLSLLKPGDTLLATEVSRITRSTKQLREIIEMAKIKQVKLILGNFIVDCTSSLDPMTEGMLKMKYHRSSIGTIPNSRKSRSQKLNLGGYVVWLAHRFIGIWVSLNDDSLGIAIEIGFEVFRFVCKLSSHMVLFSYTCLFSRFDSWGITGYERNANNCLANNYSCGFFIMQIW